jgi:hypothetical protein
VKIRSHILPLLLVVAATAAPAQAQWTVTPYVGINLAGDVEFRRGGPGFAAGYLGTRLGFEIDVERYNHFFKDTDVADVVPNNCGVGGAGGPMGQPCTDANSDALGISANVVAPIRLTGATKWRTYVAGGVGTIRGWVEDPSHQLADTDQNDLAINVGGGVAYALNRRVGIRGDARYFRALVDGSGEEGVLFEDYGFLRATVGVTFRVSR